MLLQPGQAGLIRRFCLCWNTIREPRAGSKRIREHGESRGGTWRGTNDGNFSRLSRAVCGKVRPKGDDSLGRREKIIAKVESAKKQRGLVLLFDYSLDPEVSMNEIHGLSSQSPRPGVPPASRRIPG